MVPLPSSLSRWFLPNARVVIALSVKAAPAFRLPLFQVAIRMRQILKAEAMSSNIGCEVKAYMALSDARSSREMIADFSLFSFFFSFLLFMAPPAAYGSS